MEVIIATALLSVIMLSLLQIKSENIFLVKKSQEKQLLKDYLSSSISFDEKKKNENKRLDDIYKFNNDEIRRDIKQIKVKIKDDELSKKTIFKNEDLNINSRIYERSYSIEDKVTKKIYTFKLEL